jgi:protein-tyrosine phosphatase
MYSVMFVCLGNICRSPLGEVIFRHLVETRGLGDKFHIESSGTGSWHVGEPAHTEAAAVAKERGISLADHSAQQISKKHIEQFDLLVAMDRDNRKNVKRMLGNSGTELVCLREYDEEGDDLDVPDPYYLPDDSFPQVFDIIFRSCEILLDRLEKKVS